MAEPQRSPDQEFAEWYVWAKREISTDNRVCQGAAQAAMGALAEGADRPSAIRAARRSQAGQSLTLASQVPALRRSYAEWYDWARRELGGDPERLHRATGAAIAALQQGGSSTEAAAAARATVPLAAPPPPPPGYTAPGPPEHSSAAEWTHPADVHDHAGMDAPSDHLHDPGAYHDPGAHDVYPDHSDDAGV